MENIQLFEEYIAGSLDPEQRAKFEKKLKSDKVFASDFKIFLFTVDGIIREEHQDNADFENAMKHISKEELLDVIGRRRFAPAFRFGYMRERVRWISGIAALFIIGFSSVFFTWQMGNQNVDDLIVDRYYIAEARGGSEDYMDINEMSKKEVKEYLPVLIAEYEQSPSDEMQAGEETGLRIALAYLRIHDRKQARTWLGNLIERFNDDELFVAQCQKILEQID